MHSDEYDDLGLAPMPRYSMTAGNIYDRTTTPSPLVAGASKDRLQTGAVVVQDKINGHSRIFGFSARELQTGS